MNTSLPTLKLSLPSSHSPTPKLRKPLSLIQSVTESVDITHTNDNRICDVMMTETKSVYYSPTISIQTSSPNVIEESISGIPTLALLLSFSAIDQDVILQNNGYQKIEKICDTLQGQLFKAIKIDSQSTQNPHYVAIKKTDKTLLNQRIAIQDDDNFCVSENIIKESLILKYLTIDNQCIGNYIVKYIDFFESDTDYYLVMEYIDSQMNLREFVAVCHEYIKNGNLSIKEYNKMIKYLLWQLFVTIQWLHISMHCCHLDLCMENIMVINGKFIKTKHGVSIDPNLSAKLCDFGLSEIFKADIYNSRNNGATNISTYLCEKQGLSLENGAYFAPKVFDEDIFDARCADNWSLGMILFECITGKHLYEPMDINTDSIQSGYWSLHNKKLKKYLFVNDILTYFNTNSFDLLNGLLNIDEHQRLKGMDILTHKWFKMYYKKYEHKISKKFKRSNPIKMSEYHRFPFYQLN